MCVQYRSTGSRSTLPIEEHSQATSVYEYIRCSFLKMYYNTRIIRFQHFNGTSYVIIFTFLSILLIIYVFSRDTYSEIYNMSQYLYYFLSEYNILDCTSITDFNSLEYIQISLVQIIVF